MPNSCDTMVPIPNPHVKPKIGVKMATHLAMTTRACFSSGWIAAPTPLLNILYRTTIKTRRFMATIVRAEITNASRAFDSYQFSTACISFGNIILRSSCWCNSNDRYEQRCTITDYEGNDHHFSPWHLRKDHDCTVKEQQCWQLTSRRKRAR